MKRSKIYYAEASYDNKEINAVIKVLKKQRLNLMSGPQTTALEKKVSEIFNMKYGLMTNSGSSSNLLGIKSLKLENQSEVITPALTFSTTISPLVHSQLIPVFIDIDYKTLQIDTSKIHKAINKKTKAIMVPNLIGNVADWFTLREIANEYNLLLIEDSADTIGYEYFGKKYAKADVCTTSLYASHLVTGAGFGGLVCFNNNKHFNLAKSLRSWGRRSSQYGETEDYRKRFNRKISGYDYDDKYIFDELGYNFIGSDISAAFALENIKKLKKNIYSRILNFNKLIKIFHKYNDYVDTFDTTENYKTGWLAFPFVLKNKFASKRKALQIFLEKSNIQTRTIFTGNITKQPVSKLFKWKKYGQLNFSDKVMQSGILIGCHQKIHSNDLSYLENKLDIFFSY